MPEIKHTFTAGKMNKDLDERLVPNGEYRSALNVQVRTTDGDSDGIGNAGTVQNLEGNSAIGEAYATTGYDGLSTKFVGSISDEKSDKAYFFAAAPTPELGILRGIPLSNGQTGFISLSDKTSRKTWVDSIIEVNTNLQEAVPVFQDVFAVTASKFDLFFTNTLNPQGSFVSSQTVDYPTGSYTSFLVEDASGIRPGMKAYAQYLQGSDVIDLFYANATTDSDIPGVEVIDVQFNDSGTDDRIIILEQQTADLSLATHYKFIHKERVLNFDYYKLITSINIVDNLLFYTDGNDEPKKINIKRSKQGTESNNYTSDPQHTKLFVNGDPQADELQIITDVEGMYPAGVKKEHVTVIRKKPINAPTLFMQTTTRTVDVNFSLEYAFVDPSLTPITPTLGTQRVVGGINEDIISSIFVNDILEFSDFTSNPGAPVTIRAKVIDVAGNSDLEADEILVEIVFIDEDLSELNQLFEVKLEQNRPLFQTKFGRFAYRYQYEDNEYSAFSPWSELAFLPGNFLYTPSKGFNDGMSNNVRQLIIKDFIPHDSIRPSDVKAVDLLWKTTDNANVYVIKTINREINNEWEGFAYDNADGDVTGRIQITSEMIHRVLPSNQLLRSWDNVPRSASAQEVTGSRIVYGNYKQGYDINTAVGLKQYIKSRPINVGFPAKSIKTQREYKFGMVFGDKYGRETPVIANGYMSDDETSVSGDISVEKNLSAFSNIFTIQQDWAQNPTRLNWIDYVKYYVKETSNEYYNLVLDRFYNAEDGNIWLSFPSADRNKVDEETYLILKNEQGSQEPVEEKAKYKIIAIENEAPDYIKKDSRVFGKYKISRNVVYDFVYNTDTGVPEGLIKTKKVTISRDRWQPDNVKNSDFKGEKMGRIVAEWTSPTGVLNTFRSPYKKISRVIDMRSGGADEGDAEDGTYNLDINSQKQGVVFAESFKKEEVDAYDYFANVLGYDSDININNVDGIAFGGDMGDGYNTSGDDYIEYFVEIKDEVVENKPEFDGRFFVKIERDDILNRKVLKQQVGDWAVDEVYEFGYISTETENPGVAAAPGTDYSTTTWNNYSTTFTLTDANPENVIGSGENIYLNNYWQNTGFGANNDQAGDSSISPFFDQSTAIETENYLSWWAGGPEEDSSIANRTSAIFIDNMNSVSYHGANTGGITNIPNKFSLGWSFFGTESNYEGGFYSAGYNQGQSDVVEALNNLNAFDSVGNAFNPVADGGDNYLSYQQIDNAVDSSDDWENLVGFTSNQIAKRLNGLHGRPGAVANHKNAMWLSVVGPKDDVLWQNSPDIAGNNLANFKAVMQTEGTLFRFRGDPGTGVFKVEKTPIANGEYGDIYSTDINGVTFNFMDFPDENDDDSPFKERQSILVHFVKLDTNGNPLENEGIDISVWDPRSTVQHNGVGSIVIDILTPLEEELSTESLQTSSACWETEPKEEVALDIYYEASDCIPIKLKRNNIQSFVKSSNNTDNASIVSGFQRGAGTLITAPDISSGLSTIYACEVYGDDGVKLKSLENGVLSDYNTTISNNNAFGVAINDVIQFRHNTGLVTRAKVIDHYTIDNYDNVKVPKPVTRVTGFTAQMNAGSTTFNVGAGTGIALGMEVLVVTANGANYADAAFSTVVQSGSFVTDINPQDGFTIITISRPINLTLNVDGGAAFLQFVEPTGIFKLEKEVWKHPVDLAWFNCYSFGNGVESDRIRDDFNAPQIDNGCRVSSTFLEYGEEKIGSGMIYSGLYNSISSVNNLNEFNMAEKITKNLNPSVGSIQAMKTRDTDVIVFAEDKVLRVLSNKDAVFNADGNTNLTATSKVLGTAIPYVGDYGISKNPESLAVDQYRMYFTDKQRGAVLRLSRDGLTPISNVGMKSYFRETLKDCEFIVGNFDIVNGEYNISLSLTEEANQCTTNSCPLTTPQSITVSFNEGSKAWVSFKSFVFSTGLSCNGKYLTTPMAIGTISNLNDIWMHYSEDATRNKFYNVQRHSEIEVIFNDEPSVVKSFKTLGYTGSQAQVNKFSTEAQDDETPSYTDGEFYNLAFKPGWYVDSFNTNFQEGNVSEFISKENKWYNKITGLETTVDNLDASDISVQGIGFPLALGLSAIIDAPAEIDSEGNITATESTEVNITIVAEPLVAGSIIGSQASWGVTYFLTEGPSGGTPPYNYAWGLVGTLVVSQFTDEFPLGFFPNLNTGATPIPDPSFNVSPSFNNQTFNNGGTVQCTITDSSDTPQSITLTSSLTEYIYPE